MPFGNPGPYPIPNLVTAYGTGPRWLKMHQFQKAFAAVTIKHIYEDSGASYQTIADDAPILWLIEYDGLLLTEAAVIDNHRADAFGEVYGFDFTNPRTSVLYTNVHYDESFDEDHLTPNININRRSIRLIKRPS